MVTSVELEGTAQAMRRLPVAATARICKLRCGWLPVNERESMIDPDRKPGCSACSTVGLNPETIDHMFECQSTSRVALIENKFASFNATMQSLGTCKYIRRTLRFGLLYWVKGNVPLEIADFALPDSPLGLLVARAYTEQSLIGWNMAFRGFLSQSWKTAQELHFSQDLSRGTVNGTTWVATIVSWLFELFAEVWAQRNLDEFGVDLEDQRKKKLVLCERAIRRLHAVGQTLPDSERFPFRTDIETLLSKRLPIQERWISSTERFLPGALKRVAARAASGQRSITEFFKRKTVEVVEDRVDREVADSGVT